VSDTLATYVPAPADPEPTALADPPLRLTLTRPTPTSTIITVAGELDLSTAPRLAEILTARPESATGIVVVNLAAVTFLGAAGMEVLAQAHFRAKLTGPAVRLVTGSHCVDRALYVTGLDRELPCYADLDTALASSGCSPVADR
jgi:anti-sigma B factor antagonist